MLINPIINKENIAAISLLVPFGASLNSFQTKTHQIIATTGAALLRAYEIAGLAAPAPIKLITMPPIHIKPPSIPVR